MKHVMCRKQTQTVAETLGCTHCGVLKVVQTIVCEDEPSPLPGLDSSSCGANSQRQRGSARGERAIEREGGREEHRSTESSNRQADGCMSRQTDDDPRTDPRFIPIVSLNHRCTTSNHALTITKLHSPIWIFPPFPPPFYSI